MRVKAQKIPQTSEQINATDIIYLFCVYFPSYKYYEAAKLPYKRIMGMIKMYEKVYYSNLIEQVRIARSPHAKNESKNLIGEYQERIRGDRL